MTFLQFEISVKERKMSASTFLMNEAEYRSRSRICSKLPLQFRSNTRSYMSSSKLCYLRLIKQKYCLNHLKIQTRLPHVCNLKPCLQYTCSLVCNVLDFLFLDSLFQDINRINSDVADFFTTTPRSNIITILRWFFYLIKKVFLVFQKCLFFIIPLDVFQ